MKDIFDTSTLIILGLIATFLILCHLVAKRAMLWNSIAIILICALLRFKLKFLEMFLAYFCPLTIINLIGYLISTSASSPPKISKKYKVKLPVKGKTFQIDNIRRGVSVIGAAGSGKTESLVYNFLKHFSHYGFSGILHDYKDFELTEMAYPLFKDKQRDFYTISFDPIIYRVNPIAPRYLTNEEAVNEVTRVLMENLLEQKESGASNSSKFFNDAAEGLIAGMIWRLRTSYPQYCSLPHLIALYQLLDTDSLIAFLKSDHTSNALADAFINGQGSDRQTAGVKSTLSNALKRISTKRIFYVLSKDEIPLDINNPFHPSVISIVNNPKYEHSYSPVIATIMHTVIKQMSLRNKHTSFLLMEEAPTIRLLNMHRIPATLRSYDIATVYVMQDKIQNDMMYGDKASKAILSNLSYQFFGKVNDPDTAKYYERFFEIIKSKTKSISKGGGTLNFDTRVTTGEKEIAKRRAEVFFRLKEGEFIAYADGIDRNVKFQQPHITREMPRAKVLISDEEITLNFNQIYEDIRSIFLS